MKKPIKVIFRTDGKHVFALFPTDPAESSHWWACTCFEHIGQHSAADPQICMRRPYRPALRGEWQPLARELRGRGYRLIVGHRVTRHDAKAREMEWSRTHKRTS